MKNPKDIPHLIKLLDDESPDVQQKVLTELVAFGATLKKELRKVPFILNPIQKEHINRIFAIQNRVYLKKRWPDWYKKKRDVEKLEEALCLLSEFLNGPYVHYSPKSFLDNLALQYNEKHKMKDIKLLAKFLFKEKGIEGNENDYYNPQNSNLNFVIKEKKGIPISLTCLYMLIGSRLGLDIEGCQFPGHFLARIKTRDQVQFVDCFSSGQILEEQDIVNVREDMVEGISEILYEKADVESIVKRYLANLIRAYQIQENEENAQLMISLFKDLELHIMDRHIAHITPEDIIHTNKPKFQPGQVVYHNRYRYRGIVVEFDNQCDATDDWYYGNQTQPTRSQPWYHVLVDGTEQVTYVAESNVSLDKNKSSIVHPLISYFFSKSKDGKYVRNDNPWPDTDF